jgi:prevent-host-death family protein
MATIVNIHEAKTHLSRLLDRVYGGEEIIIAKAGRPVARLVAAAQQPERRAGECAGRTGRRTGVRRGATGGGSGRLRAAVNLLLDTHAFLWWVTDDPRMSPHAREIIAHGGNTLFFSAASRWEIAIKARLGRLQVPENLGRFLPEQLSRKAIRVLPIHLSHALHVHELPEHHRDPFDCLLVSQALLENLPILSVYSQLAR